MRQLIDLTGKTFGRWTVIERSPKNSGQHPRWICRCECGTVRDILGHQLREGVSKSCGCLQKEGLAARRTIDLTGQSFWRWNVIGRISSTENGQPTWLCQCICGTRRIVQGRDLREGRSRSCGCTQKERKKTEEENLSDDWKTHLQRNYNIDVDTYFELLKLQNNGCAICGETDPSTKVKTAFDVDHDHITGKVRGLLCSSCNSGLGLWEDSVEKLRKAIDYLENPPFFKLPKSHY